MAFEYTDKGYKTLSIGFTSFQSNIITFDWKVLKKLDTDVLLLRDEKMAWYVCGLTDISDNVIETSNFIKEYSEKYDRVYLFGSSMGGYAALLYGYLIDHKNTIINVFSPQTDIKDISSLGSWTADMIKDNVYPYINASDKSYLSLSGVRFPKNTFIHHGIVGIDMEQAHKIKCNKIKYDECESHSIAWWMHERGMLRPYLKSLYK